MYKKLLCLILVLGMAGIANANLVSHWDFEDGSGTIATDVAGGKNATLSGTYAWVAGIKGANSIDFDSTPSIGAAACAGGAGGPLGGITNEITLAWWSYGDGPWGTPSEGDVPFFAYGAGPHINTRLPAADGTSVMWMADGSGWTNVLYYTAAAGDLLGKWTHWAFTKDAVAGTMDIYKDLSATAVASATGMTSAIAGSSAGYFLIGHYAGPAWGYHGKMDDVRLYDNCMTGVEVAAIYDPCALGRAYNFDPKNNAFDVGQWPVLSWTPGAYTQDVNGHKVYFSTTFADVNDRTVTPVIRTEPNYATPGTLDFNTPHYWAVDEVNGTGTWAGSVLQFKTWDGIVDPLILWFKFDEGSGTTIKDYSRLGLDGTLVNSPPFVPGCPSAIQQEATPYAIEVNTVNVGHVTAQALTYSNITTEISRVFWAKTETGTPAPSSVGLLWGPGGTVAIGMPWPGEVTLWICGPGWGPAMSSPMGDYDTWNHWAFTKNANTGLAQIFMNGDNVATSYAYTAAMDLSTLGNAGMGNNWATMEGNNQLDDWRDYNKGLSESEVERAGGFRDLNKAYAPVPVSGTDDIDIDGVYISWSPGDNAGDVNGHRVYIGTDYDDVNDGTVGYTVRTDANYPTGPLTLGATYYWRIDEVNGVSTTAGDIWNFDTESYLVFEDFESYADSNDLQGTWIDDIPGYDYRFLEEAADYVHGGGKAMRFETENYYAPYHMEVARTNSTGTWDFTAQGVQVFSFYFKGDPTNLKQRMFVTVTDDDSPKPHSGTWYYDDPNDLLDEAWVPWRVARVAFSDPNFGKKVTMSNVKSIAIGVDAGTTSPPSGDLDYLYIDDIGLYPRHCTGEPELGPVGDITHDCVCDEQDIQAMSGFAGVWLEKATGTVAASPNSPTGLVGHWKFDEGSGNDANDSVGTNHGTFVSNVVWTTGIKGSALEFSGGSVTVPALAVNDVNNAVTISMWTYGDASLPGALSSIASGTIFSYGPTGGIMLAGVPFTPSGMSLWCAGTGWANQIGKTSEDSSDFKGQWNHWAFTKDIATGDMKMYLNGLVWHEAGGYTQPIRGFLASQFVIGSYADAYYWYGKIDDVRLYTRALPHGEIIDLAGLASVNQPLVGAAYDIDEELVQDGSVDFLDYNKLANNWLAEGLWPPLE